MLPVISEIETAVDRRWFVFPGLFDDGNGRVGNAQFSEAVVVDDVLGGLQAHVVKLVSRKLDPVDFSGAKRIIRRLVPVRAVFGVMIDETDLFDFFLPFGARSNGNPFHTICAESASDEAAAAHESSAR